MRSILALLLLTATSFAAKPLSRPSVQAQYRGRIRYSNQPGVLARGRMKGEDAIMKIGGPCSLVSVIAGIAHSRPGFLDEALVEREDGSVALRYYRRSRETGKYVADYEPVDRAVLRWKGSGDAFNMQSRKSDELWPALIEKIYAKLKGGMKTYTDGAVAGDIMTMLTGKRSTLHWVAAEDEDELFQRMKRSLSNGKTIVAGTYTSESFRSAASAKRIEATDFRGALHFVKKQEHPSYTGTGVWAEHAYTVWAVKKENGRRYVQLRDPFGKRPAVEGAPSLENDTGIFWLPYEQFRVLYEDVHIGA